MRDRPVMLCAGSGYVAQALAARLLRRGWRVVGTTRDPARKPALAAMGIEPEIWPPAPAAAAGATHVLVSAPPDERGDPTLRAIGPALAANPGLKWVGYLSTTGVYGDHGGGWVDEASPLNPAPGRAERRAAAEAEWRAAGLPLHIFRIAGIYGPGRAPFERIRAGAARRIVKEGQVFSRIHRDDIAAALLASIERPSPGAVYNLSDDLPAPPEDVIAYAAELLGVAAPPAVRFEDAEMSPMARSFYAESRRVSNRRMREELGVRLAYPTYREGLAAILAEESRS
ncbi:SDR family oxidoreductase [Pikeienuella sp. HZG-20]|uniref:SDR family oxidoreductase n=1 Tax=Paludibacillus litoralis TaxID=3133267 RepID=UPI0030EF6011